MKNITISLLFLFSNAFVWAQHVDSIVLKPQVLELTISTPQPRHNETFQVSIDVNHLRANIFKSLAGKVWLSDEVSAPNNSLLVINVNAIRKGKNEIGPLEFYLDKTKYTTNKIVYDVIDPLPKTDEGLWFRKVITSDSTFSVIIEQYIPANTKTTKTSENSITITDEPEFRENTKFKEDYSIDGVISTSSHSSTNFSSIVVNGQEKQLKYSYSVYNFEILDKRARIKISKDKFDDIPTGYKFEDIIIQ